MANLAITTRWLDRLLVLGAYLTLIVALGVVAWTLRGRSASTNPLSIDVQIGLTSAFATKGSRAAPVVVIEFSDFQCPYCARFAELTEPQIQKQYVDSGRVLWVFRHLPLAAVHPVARYAALAAECGRSSGRFWEMHDLLFSLRRPLTEEAILDGTTRLLGVNRDVLKECLTRAAPAVDQDIVAAEALSITGTPSFVLGRLRHDTATVRATLAGAVSADMFRKELDRLLAEVAAR